MTIQNEYPPTYQGVVQVMKRLRGPNGCPWDREQTHESMKAQILEECYELIDAIERDDTGEMVEEIGDVFYHTLFQIDMGDEKGRFGERDVFGTLIAKLVRRHPHVFDDVEVSGSNEVINNWQAIKRKEREGTDRSILDGVPKQMPALAYALAVQERASRVGFDWDDIGGVLDKVTEELGEIREAESEGEREHELGDLLFSIANAARWMGIDAEASLRHANARFYGRFGSMERLSRERQLSFVDLSMDEKEAIWEEAKAIERG